MKVYNILVRLEFNHAIDGAETEQEAIEILKDSFKQEYNIDLDDREIIEIEVDDNENN